MNHKLLLLCAIALVSAPVLAGCAQNNGDTNATPTGATPPTTTTTTPTTNATPTLPTSPTSVIPTTATPLSPKLTLKLGLMNPLSGPLANLGPSMQKSMELAVSEINAQSAVTGFTVEVVGKEDDTTVDQSRATAAYDSLVGKGATVIAGPCCSGITGAVLTKAVEDQVVISSPSATSPTLTETDRQGYFWRVSPTDAGQGRVLAQMMDADNVTKANLIIVNNDYGNGFATVFTQEFEAKGGDVGTTSKIPEQEGAVVSTQVTEACAGSPEAIVLVVYTKDGAEVLKAMQAQGCLSKVKLYASEGIYSPVLAGSVVEQAGKDPSGKYLAQGMKGTTPQATDPAFNQKYGAKYPGESPQQYAPESWDSVMYLALAALKAKSVEGEDISKALLSIANPAGTKCREYRECALLLLAGQEIDFRGYAHDLEFSDKHEPKVGAYAYWQVQADGTMKVTRENVLPA